MKIGLAQINPTIGDLAGNLELAKKAYDKAVGLGAEIVVFPEMSVIGYCPKDLLAKELFRKSVEDYAQKWCDMTDGGPGIIFGSVSKSTLPFGKSLYNTAYYAEKKYAVEHVCKALLPTYDVFDEERWFQPNIANMPVRVGRHVLPRRPDEQAPTVAQGLGIGLCICEDIWNDKDFWNKRLYSHDPVTFLVDQGIDIIVNISASPYATGKPEVRRQMLSHAAKKYQKPIIYVNQVGANDDVVYDGRSMVINKDGHIVLELQPFKEDVGIVDLEDLSPLPFEPGINENEDIFNALVLGVRDYARKCGFKSALIGLSGGIDSALTAVIAKEALGPENVLGVGMPSKFSSTGSVTDAELLAKNLGMPFRKVQIKDIYSSFHGAMHESENPDSVQLWQENLQARIRGSILMSISNGDGRLLLTTGNKSEVAVGYCTLYGDTCGGLAVLSDVFKTKVYDLARWYNRAKGKVIPSSSIDKAPSAELRPNQKDQDSLPPYDELDAILRLMIEEDMEPAEIAAKLGMPEDKVLGIAKKVDRNEYKRRQLAPGIRVTKKAFGTGRLVPIAQGWRS